MATGPSAEEVAAGTVVPVDRFAESGSRALVSATLVSAGFVEDWDS